MIHINKNTPHYAPNPSLTNKKLFEELKKVTEKYEHLSKYPFYYSSWKKIHNNTPNYLKNLYSSLGSETHGVTTLNQEDSKMATFTTQKAKGVFHLVNEGHHIGKYGVYSPKIYGIIPSFTNKLKDIKFPVFARPCPETPRHGFVESKSVKGWDEVMELYRKAINADSRNAELILMPRLTGRTSGVVTEKGVTYGSGNQGVTGGKSSFHIPTPGDRNSWNQIITGYSVDNVGIKDTAYLELVEDEGNMTVVQLRDGPNQPGGNSVNYIPKSTTIKKIIYVSDTDGDLLEFEKMIKKNKDVDGVVLYAPNMALSSHFAVHAIQHNIPVITSNEGLNIKEGETLSATTNVVSPLQERDYKDIAWNILKEFRFSSFGKKPREDYYNTARNYCMSSVATIQTQHYWDNKEHLLLLRGRSITRLLRLGFSACLGEMRHKKGETSVPYPFGYKSSHSNGNNYPKDRSMIYNHSLPLSSLEDIIKYFPYLIKDFEEESVYETGLCGCGCGAEVNDQVIKGWEGGYGGRTWAHVAKTCFDFANKVQKFLEKPDEETWSQVILSANIFINSSHNNGKILTKWVGEDILSNITSNPVVGFLSAEVAEDVVFRTKEW